MNDSNKKWRCFECRGTWRTGWSGWILQCRVCETRWHANCHLPHVSMFEIDKRNSADLNHPDRDDPVKGLSAWVCAGCKAISNAPPKRAAQPKYESPATDTVPTDVPPAAQTAGPAFPQPLDADKIIITREEYARMAASEDRLRNLTSQKPTSVKRPSSTAPAPPGYPNETKTNKVKRKKSSLHHTTTAQDPSTRTEQVQVKQEAPDLSFTDTNDRNISIPAEPGRRAARQVMEQVRPVLSSVDPDDLSDFPRAAQDFLKDDNLGFSQSEDLSELPQWPFRPQGFDRVKYLASLCAKGRKGPKRARKPSQPRRLVTHEDP